MATNIFQDFKGSGFGNLATLLGLREDPQIELLRQRQAKIDEVIGQSPTDSFSSAEFDPQGNEINVRERLSGGTGLLNDPNNLDARLKARGQLIGAGASPQQVSALLGAVRQPETNKPTTLQNNLLAAGVDLNTPEGQSTMLGILQRPGTQINNILGGSSGLTSLTPEQKDNLNISQDRGAVVTGKGEVKVLPVKFSEAQTKASGFADRMVDSQTDIENIKKQYPDFDPAGAQFSLFKRDSALGQVGGNAALSSAGQIYQQAQENWISANLRRESGAVLGEEEISSEKAKWFPVFGDSPETIAQKKASRERVTKAIIQSSGGAFDELQKGKKSNKIPSGLKDNGDGTFTTADGKIVRRK